MPTDPEVLVATGAADGPHGRFDDDEAAGHSPPERLYRNRA
ncbi:hypothetical protein [Streptomyces pimonensis]